MRSIKPPDSGSTAGKREIGDRNVGIAGAAARWEGNRETAKWRRSMDGSLSRWLVGGLSTKTTSLWFHTRGVREREGRAIERERYRAAVNNSEFLWSGPVCSFGRDRRRRRREATILDEEEQEEIAPSENRSIGDNASISVTTIMVSCAMNVESTTMTASEIEQRDVVKLLIE